MSARGPRVRRFVASEEPLDVVQAMNHSALFRQWFNGASWDAWRAILKAAFCLEMSEQERALFRSVAEREPPKRRPRELVIIVGRGGGKDSIASLIGTYEAVFFRAGIDRLRSGERALVQCLACDREQAKIVLGYIRSYFEHIPPLREMVIRQTADGVELCNDVDIVVATNSFRAVRGRAILVSIFDEVAFWQDERSARPDVETYRAVLPGMARLPGSMLIMISSPYRRGGLLFSKFKKHYGRDDDDVLVIKAPSLTLNPTLDRAIIDKALEDDPPAARAEWLGEFREDVAAFIDQEAVEACVSNGVHERARMAGVQYFAFTDPSGGSSDSMTLAIAHRDGEGVALDCVRERRPPFSPDDVVLEFCATLKSYGISSVRGDRYAGEWPRERFRVRGVSYEPAEQPKSDLYRDLLPILNSGRAELLDHQRLVAQFCSLERRTARSGKDSIDHPPGAHDDVANAVAGALLSALGQQSVVVTSDLLARAQSLPRHRMPGRAWSRPFLIPTN